MHDNANVWNVAWRTNYRVFLLLLLFFHFLIYFVFLLSRSFSLPRFFFFSFLFLVKTRRETWDLSGLEEGATDVTEILFGSVQAKKITRECPHSCGCNWAVGDYSVSSVPNHGTLRWLCLEVPSLASLVAPLSNPQQHRREFCPERTKKGGGAKRFLSFEL